MNAEQKELFRLAILRVLDRYGSRFGLSIVAIGHSLNIFGFSVGTFAGDAEAFYNAIADDLQYLTNKGFAEEALKHVSKENRAWRITDSIGGRTNSGKAFLDQQI